MCAHPTGRGVCDDCWRLPAAARWGGIYAINAVNPCRNPQVVEVLDMVPVPGSTIQQSNSQTGERQSMHGGAWEGSAREWASHADGSDLLGRDQSRVGCVQHLQSGTLLQHAIFR